MKRLLASLLFSTAVLAVPGDGYVARLRALDGKPYVAINCARLITIAKQHADCSARQMWDGCSGDLAVIQEAASIDAINIPQLQDGDVLDFAGSHVAAIVDGGIVDSVPERGVGRVAQINRFDPWYSGRVRILRWRQS